MYLVTNIHVRQSLTDPRMACHGLNCSSPSAMAVTLSNCNLMSATYRSLSDRRLVMAGKSGSINKAINATLTVAAP
jgi:hypothetical protein